MWDLRIGAKILTLGSIGSIGTCTEKVFKISVMSGLEIRTVFQIHEIDARQELEQRKDYCILKISGQRFCGSLQP